MIAVIVVLVATAYGRGDLAGGNPGSGALVRWGGYGVAQTVQNVAAAATIGALFFAAFIVPPVLRGRKGRGSGSRTADLSAAEIAAADEHPAFSRIMVLASVASLVWTLSAGGRCWCSASPILPGGCRFRAAASSRPDRLLHH